MVTKAAASPGYLTTMALLIELSSFCLIGDQLPCVMPHVHLDDGDRASPIAQRGMLPIAPSPDAASITPQAAHTISP
jgi:hypothetical protein